MKRSVYLALSACFLVAEAAAGSVVKPVPIPDRAAGADRVVVASVTDVTATYETNEFGDRLIVSHVTLGVEEVLKGRSDGVLSMDLDGGTVDGITLEVSSLPKLQRGERAVFFLKQNARGNHVPHLRGQGILKLDGDDKVRGATSLTLAQIRQMTAQAGR